MSLLGLTQVVVLQKQNQDISVESGTIIAADPDMVKTFGFQDFSSHELQKFMQQGRGLAFGTGGDGVFTTQLRLVEAPEPLLSASEYKRVVASTDTIAISTTSGIIAIDDLGLMVNQLHQNQMKVEPGNYKIGAYLLDNEKDFRVFCVVLSRSDIDNNSILPEFYILE